MVVRVDEFQRPPADDLRPVHPEHLLGVVVDVERDRHLVLADAGDARGADHDRLLRPVDGPVGSLSRDVVVVGAHQDGQQHAVDRPQVEEAEQVGVVGLVQQGHVRPGDALGLHPVPGLDDDGPVGEDHGVDQRAAR